MKVKLTKTLYAEMSGGSFAQAPRTRDLFEKVGGGADLHAGEIAVLIDALDTTLNGLEAVRGGGLDFEEARDVNAAIRSARALMRKLVERAPFTFALGYSGNVKLNAPEFFGPVWLRLDGDRLDWYRPVAGESDPRYADGWHEITAEAFEGEFDGWCSYAELVEGVALFLAIP